MPIDVKRMRELLKAAIPPTWSSAPRRDESKFGDGTQVCDVFCAPGRIVAYSVGAPEAELIAALRNEAESLLDLAEAAVAWRKRSGKFFSLKADTDFADAIDRVTGGEGK